jgi:hypothetical protein
VAKKRRLENRATRRVAAEPQPDHFTFGLKPGQLEEEAQRGGIAAARLFSASIFRNRHTSRLRTPAASAMTPLPPRLDLFLARRLLSFIPIYPPG